MVGEVGDHPAAGLFLILVPLLRGERGPLQHPMVDPDRIRSLCDRTLLDSGHPCAVVPAPGCAALARLSSRSSQRSIANSARVFYDKGCEYCHTISGYGGIRGPGPFSDAGDQDECRSDGHRIFSGAKRAVPTAEI